jgi:hypothetical protein
LLSLCVARRRGGASAPTKNKQTRKIKTVSVGGVQAETVIKLNYKEGQVTSLDH